MLVSLSCSVNLIYSILHFCVTLVSQFGDYINIKTGSKMDYLEVVQQLINMKDQLQICTNFH